MVDIQNNDIRIISTSHPKNTTTNYLGFQNRLNSAEINSNSPLNPNQNFLNQYYPSSFYSLSKVNLNNTTASKGISMGEVIKEIATPRYAFLSFAYTTDTQRLVFTPLMSVEKIVDFYKNSTLYNIIDVGKYIKWYGSARHIISGKGMALSVGGLNGFAPEVGVLDSKIPQAIQSQLMDRLGNAAKKIGLPQSFVNKLSGKTATIKFTASVRTTVDEPHRQMYYLRAYLVVKKGSKEAQNLIPLSNALINELFKKNPIEMIKLTQGDKTAALAEATKKFGKVGRVTPPGVAAHAVADTVTSKSKKSFYKEVELSVGMTYAPVVIEGGLENPHLIALQIPPEAFEQVAKKLYDALKITGSDETADSLKKINPAMNSSLLEEVVMLPNAMYDDTLIQTTRLGDTIKETFTSEEEKKRRLEFKNNPIVPPAPEFTRILERKHEPPQATSTQKTLSNISYYTRDTYMSIMEGSASMSKSVIDFLYESTDSIGDVIKDTMISDKAEKRRKEDNKDYIKRVGGVPDAPIISTPEPKKYVDMTGFHLQSTATPRDIDIENTKTNWKLDLAEREINPSNYIFNTPSKEPTVSLEESIVSSKESENNMPTTYKVNSGDTLGEIAEKHGGFSTLDNILKSNPQITIQDKIKANDIINLPEDNWNNLEVASSKQVNNMLTYKIKPGDTLGEIAEKHGGFSTLENILKANPQITNPDKIKAGDIIYLTNAKN